MALVCNIIVNCVIMTWTKQYVQSFIVLCSVFVKYHQHRDIFCTETGIILGFNHGVLGLAENQARGTGSWSQNTEGVARVVLMEKSQAHTGNMKKIAINLKWIMLANTSH